MPDTPLITIIIPCYNGADFVGATLESVLQQTHEHLQIVVVDDGSTDESASVIQSFADQRIEYIYQENQGLSAARNTGIRHTKGQFVNFLDADDLFLPEKLQLQLEFLQQHPAYGLVAEGFIRCDERGEHLYTSMDEEGEIPLQNLIVKGQFPVQTPLIRKTWIDKTGFFDTGLKAAEDWDFYCRMALEGCRMYRLRQANSAYRILDNAMTTNAPRQTEMLLQVVQKTFSNSKLPEKWRHLETKARFQITLMGACRCLALNYFEEGAGYLQTALAENPAAVQKYNFEPLARNLAYFIKHMQVPDWQEKTLKIVQAVGSQFPLLEKVAPKLDFHIHLVKTKHKKAFLTKQILQNPLQNVPIVRDLILYQLREAKS